jgi:ubiquinone/menaquinone biosynthesis C-methylase UbiE
VVDIGTGDGTFVYQAARENPNKFFIGIDANAKPLAKISEKIHRRQKKGGATNALFLLAAVEDLPNELDGVADEVHVHFPWGSLLAAFASGEVLVLKNVRRICASDALLEVVIGLDMDRDQNELSRLGIEEFSPAYVRNTLLPLYRSAGFEITETGELQNWSALHTSWAKRLRMNQQRRLVYLIARAI